MRVMGSNSKGPMQDWASELGPAVRLSRPCHVLWESGNTKGAAILLGLCEADNLHALVGTL